MSVLTVKLQRGDSTPWGFRLQGGKDFSSPLAFQRVNPGSLSEQGGLQAGDGLLSINGQNTDNLRHKEAQDAIIRAGNYLEISVQRGGMSIWKPSVTALPTSNAQQPGALRGEPTPVTKTSLAATQQQSQNIGSGHNNQARPFATNNLPAVVHNQYNSPANLYSMENIAEALSAQTEVLATGAVGINFMREEKPINTGSAVYQLVHQDDTPGVKGEGAPPPRAPCQRAPPPVVTKRVEAPIQKPPSDKPHDANANVCGECGRLIVGVFVRVKDRSLHAECFRCSTCGTSLKNAGYYNVNDKLYCDIHAKQAARMMGSAPTMEPITVAPGASLPYDTPILGMGPTPPSHGSTLGGSLLGGPHGGPHGGLHGGLGGPPMASPRSPGAPSLGSNYSPVPFHKTASAVHHVEAPISPLPPMGGGGPAPFSGCPAPFSGGPAPFSGGPAPFSGDPAPFSPLLMTLQPMKAPMSPVTPPVQTPIHGSTVYMHPQTAPAADSHRPVHGLNPTPGSRPAPRRGKGQLQEQGGPGARIPICSVCGTPIRGPFIVALGKTWCPDHFQCKNNQCRRPLADVGFVEEQGNLYCECCWENFLAPVCCKCQIRIKGDCLNALDKQWHPDCFVCSFCHKAFGNSSFYLEDGKPYCEKDWNELFTTKCVGCGFPIEAGDRWVEALNNNYHSQCFKCTICQKNLEGQSFYAKGGRPFCKAHAR